MKRSIAFIILALFSISACNDSKDDSTTKSLTEPATANTKVEVSDTAPILDINIPESSDTELNDFFKSYTAHLNEYVAAVRENNKSRIKASFAKERKFKIQLLDLPARLHKNAPAEWEKYQSFRSKTAKYSNEIERSEYVKTLFDEAIRN